MGVVSDGNWHFGWDLGRSFLSGSSDGDDDRRGIHWSVEGLPSGSRAFDFGAPGEAILAGAGADFDGVCRVERSVRMQVGGGGDRRGPCPGREEGGYVDGGLGKVRGVKKME